MKISKSLKNFETTKHEISPGIYKKKYRYTLMDILLWQEVLEKSQMKLLDEVTFVCVFIVVN